MKPEQIYQELIDLLEKFDISMSEQNFKATQTKTKGGFCKIKNKKIIIVDKGLSVHNKIILISAHIKTLPHEDIYLVPAVRELLKEKPGE